MNSEQRSVNSDRKTAKKTRLLASGFWLLASCFLILNLNPESALAKSRTKKAKASPAKQEEIKKEADAKISQDVIDALARGSLNEAAIELREQPTSAKSLYLLREVTRVAMHESSKKRPKRSDAHQYYQNLGVAYHNLHLFLKTNGIEQEDFAKEALKFYKKSKGYATPMHKPEADILSAALLTSMGEEEKAASLMDKIDMAKLGVDFQTQEYLAAYYAAKGDAADAVISLKEAYRERPDVILTWLAVGDDFHMIEGDPQFVSLLNEWHFARSAKRLELRLPKPTVPKLSFAEPKVQFRHPTAPQAQPHYKAAKLKKKSYVSSKRTKASKKKSTAAKATSKKTKKK